ncbi:hypothetical protein [Streptomyces sp. NPDC051665]|uniref:hypothetical protein n=1 Tax=Streptomyces sp. NPDC051665 TaxID=3154647 RepID=UPI00343B83E2
MAVGFYKHVTAAAEDALAERLRAATPVGDTRAIAAAEALIGAMLYRLLVRQLATPQFLDSLTDTVLSGIQGTGDTVPTPRHPTSS